MRTAHVLARLEAPAEREDAAQGERQTFTLNGVPRKVQRVSCEIFAASRQLAPVLVSRCSEDFGNARICFIRDPAPQLSRCNEEFQNAPI